MKVRLEIWELEEMERGHLIKCWGRLKGVLDQIGIVVRNEQGGELIQLVMVVVVTQV